MFDMVFYMNKSIFTLYNKMKAQSATNLDLCRRAASDKSLENFSLFEEIPSSSEADYDAAFISIQTLEGHSEFNMLEPSASGIPGRLRIGDIDSDGYPDLIMTTAKKNVVYKQEGGVTLVESTSVSKLSTNTFVMKNDPCTDKLCEEEATKKGRRYFKKDENDFERIKELLGSAVVAGTFMDIDEDGRLDIIFQVRQKYGNGYTNAVQVIYNNYIRDTFFIKALMLNSYKSYGDVVVGPSFRAIITDLNDEKKVVIGSQLTQSSYHSLQLPYAYVGVGRSNNYVEQFTAGYAVGGSRSIRTWSPIIPNSQLIVQAGDSNTNKWNLELFVNPTDALPLIIIACVICLLVISVIICGLYYKEKMQDKRDRKELDVYF